LHVKLIILNATISVIRKVVKRKQKAVIERHNKKLNNLINKQKKKHYFEHSYQNYLKHTVHNWSSYQLSDLETKALSFGLDQHIPQNNNENKIEQEFERFYHDLIRSKAKQEKR